MLVSTAAGQFVVMPPDSTASAYLRVFFPARRWCAKSKTWRLPATAATLKGFVSMQSMFRVRYSTDALELWKETELANVPDVFPPDYSWFTPPRDYQRAATVYAYGHRGFALLMSVRTGKTKVAIDVIRARWKQGKIDAVMIFAPKSVREVWVEEFAKHAGDVVIAPQYSGEKQYGREFTTVPVLAVYVQTLDGIGASKKQQDACKAFLAKYKRVQMVLDESHKIKSPTSKRTKVLHELGPLARYRLILTGTESDKGVHDLWAQLEFCDPAILGQSNFFAFRNRYCTMGGYDMREIVGYRNMDEFRDRVAPYVFRAGAEVLDVPDVTYQVRWVDAAPEQVAARQEFNEYRDMDMVSTMTMLLRHQQIAGGNLTPGPLFAEGKVVAPAPTWLSWQNNPKIKELLDLLEMHAGDKIVIWARFQSDIETICEALEAKHVPHYQFHGGVSAQDRVVARTGFQRGDRDVIVGNQTTGGVGIAMYAHDTARQHVVIYFSNTFSYIDRRQSEARTVIPGQTHGTIVYDILMRGIQVEKLIQKALRDKQDLSTIVKRLMSPKQ